MRRITSGAFIFWLIAFCGFLSCEKKPTTAPGINYMGKWFIGKIIANQYKSGQLINTDIKAYSGQSYFFSFNNTMLEIKDENRHYELGYYNVNAVNMVLVVEDVFSKQTFVFDMRKYTDTELVLFYEDKKAEKTTEYSLSRPPTK